MSKPRLTEQQRRERALMGAIARAATEEGLAYDKDIADAIGLTRTNYVYHKKYGFQSLTLMRFGVIARRLHLTGKEVCVALGVPYEEKPA